VHVSVHELNTQRARKPILAFAPFATNFAILHFTSGKLRPMKGLPNQMRHRTALRPSGMVNTRFD